MLVPRRIPSWQIRTDLLGLHGNHVFAANGILLQKESVSAAAINPPTTSRHVCGSGVQVERAIDVQKSRGSAQSCTMIWNSDGVYVGRKYESLDCTFIFIFKEES